MLSKSFVKALCLTAMLTTQASGCAFTDITAELPLTGPTIDFSGGKGQVLVLAPFTDKRQVSNRIGMKKNGYGQDTADVFPNKDVLPWLHERLSSELKVAGFTVATDNAGRGDVEVNGTLLKLFIEPVIQWSTVDHEADFSVQLQVKRPDGLKATRKYYVKGINQGLIASQGHYTAALNKATMTLMKRVVADLINLLNQYPETINHSNLRITPCGKLEQDFV
ncbi:YajG family lipoprotein [Candidatus Nitrospira salsa]|nr:MAG: hypothetical protein NPIRA01_35670 [Nitrospirales bacterium]